MVVLSPRFTLIASLSVIATLSLGPSTGNAAVIQARHRPEETERPHIPIIPDVASSRTQSGSFHQADGTNGRPSRAKTPTIPLPGGPAVANKRTTSRKSQKKLQELKAKDKRSTYYDPFNPLLQIGNLWVGDRPPPFKRSETIVNAGNEHVHVHHGRVVANGHAHTHRSPIPEPHHHHHHYYDHHGKVVVNGDDDDVHIHERRHHPHDHHRHHSKVVVNGDDDNVRVHKRSDPYPFEGVPGSIDIMSNVAQSDVGQKIASLVLTPGNGSVPGDPFVLDASTTNSTQMYLFVLPSESNNGTSISASSNGTTPDNSTTTDIFRKVALTIPMFDPEEAVSKPYCVTFDPQPATPAPMTVEVCTNGTQSNDHKSQVFAYYPDTRIIQPLWFAGNASDTEDSTYIGEHIEDSDSDLEDDEAGPPLVSEDGSNNSTSTSSSTSPSNSSDASAMGFNGRMLDAEFGDATRPPAAAAKSFAANGSYGSAHNVTLVFKPAEAIAPVANLTSSGDESSSIPATPSSTLVSSASTAQETVPVTAAAMNAVPTSSVPSTASASASTSSPSVLATSVSPTQDPSASQANPTAGALDVEVVDRNADTAANGSSSSTASASAATTPSASVSPSFSTFGAFALSSTEVASSTTSSAPCTSTAASGSIHVQDIDSPAPSSTGTAATSSMTPVSTAPYEWMFKEGVVHHT